MNKSTLIKHATIPLIILGIILSSCAYIPLLRVCLGVDESITIHFSTVLVYLIGGYMAGLAGLIAWLRTIPTRPNSNTPILNTIESTDYLHKPHLLGLTFLIPIPFISFLLLGFFWKKDRHFSRNLDDAYRTTINFHLAIHLYFLVSFFLMPVVIGFLMIALLFATYLLATFYNIIKTNQTAKYPINIKIVV